MTQTQGCRAKRREPGRVRSGSRGRDRKTRGQETAMASLRLVQPGSNTTSRRSCDAPANTPRFRDRCGPRLPEYLRTIRAQVDETTNIPAWAAYRRIFRSAINFAAK